MTWSALTFLLVVWTLVISMVVYCYSKMLRSGRRLDNGDEPRQVSGGSHET